MLRNEKQPKVNQDFVKHPSAPVAATARQLVAGWRALASGARADELERRIHIEATTEEARYDDVYSHLLTAAVTAIRADPDLRVKAQLDGVDALEEIFHPVQQLEDPPMLMNGGELSKPSSISRPH